MLPLTLSIVFAVISVPGVSSYFTSCPTDYWNIFGDKCYKMTHDKLNWDDARALCQRDGGDLVSIHSSEENDALQAAMPGCCAYWIGLRCNSNSEAEWADGTPVDFVSNDDIRGCDPFKAFYFLQSNGKWLMDISVDPSVYIICQVGAVGNRTTTTTPGSPTEGHSECGFGYELLPDGMCVKISTNRTTWSDAERACQKDGAHLASIHSKQSNDFIRNLALSHRITNAIFIGFHLEDQTGIWQDNTDLDYTNFNPGMPNNMFGNCVAMQTGTLQGEWTSVFCDDSNLLPYACSKPQPCPAQNTFTVSGDVGVRDSPSACAIKTESFSSPEYPSSLSTGLYCEYFIATSPGSLVLLRFDEFQLLDGDKVILYEGEGDTEPLAVITSVAPTDRFMTKNLGVMRIVHLTGNGVGVRKWNANFVSV